MKTYRALAYKELLASKITSVLILIAVILSTMMTTAIGQSWVFSLPCGISRPLR